jgi:glycine/D-amino acid oxidase-like deaminating enzyme
MPASADSGAQIRQTCQRNGALPLGQAIAHSGPMLTGDLTSAVQIDVGKSLFHGPEAFGSWNRKQSPFEQMRVLDPAPSRRTIAAILKAVTEQFPAMAGLEIADSWGAYVDFTPDAVPVISAADGVKGLYLAAGAAGHGFGIGPGIGRLAADLVANDSPCVDPTPFRLSRFLDGSRLKVGEI